MLTRTRSLSLAVLAALTAAEPALAQKEPASYPARAVTIVNPFPPGGSVDTMTRLLAQKLNEAWVQPVVVDNRSGASGTIGLTAVARAPADGYTLGIILITHAANVSLQGIKQPYDLTRDFTPVTQFMSQPYVLVVNPSLPVRSIGELIALAKAKPDAVTYGSSGVGSMLHLAGELFATQARVKITHVPYKGVAPALTGVAGGHVAMVFAARASAQPLIAAGRLRAIAVTVPQRLPAAPELPTMRESGMPGLYDVTGWYGIGGPAGLPAPIVEKLYQDVGRVLKLADVRERMAVDSIDPVGSTPAQFAALIRSEIERWRRVVQQAGVPVGST